MAVAPSIPQNFAVQAQNNQVLASWNLVAGATSYPLYRSTDNVSFTLLVSPATNQYLDTTVTQGTQYFYKVASSNGTVSPFTISIAAIPATSGLMSLGQLRQLARQRADREQSQFVTDPEVNLYVNQSLFELYDLLVTVYEDYYVQGPVLFKTNGTDFQYPLPDGISNNFTDMAGNVIVPPPFYKMLGVDCGLALNTNAWVSLHKFNFNSRNRYVFPNISSTYLGVFNLRYRLLDNTIMFIPTPSAFQYIRIWYVKRLKELLQDTDLCDGVSGWTEYLIVDAAIKILQKEESDVSVLMAQKMALIDRIQSSAMNRDAGEPDTVSNVRSYISQAGGWGSPNGDGSYGGY